MVVFMKDSLYLLLLIFFLSGCGTTRPWKAPPTQDPAALYSVTLESLSPAEPFSALEGADEIELTWKVPDTAVDGFIIHYGYSPENLLHEVIVEESELRIFDDYQHGMVFRYLVKGVDRGRELHIAITAFKGSSVSDSSEVIKVAAE